MSIPDRILLLLTALLAAYQIVVGIDAMGELLIIAYTIAFGVLLVAVLLLMILGFEVLDSPIVVIVSTIIPLCLATGLVWQYAPSIQISYLLFTILEFAAVVITRSISVRNKLPVLTLAVVHGVAGMTIFLLPIILSVRGTTEPLFSLVSVGGALIGVGGLLLAFLKTGKPILPKETILKLLPSLLLVMTLCFVIGFKYA